jgi:hypothetical protein
MKAILWQILCPFEQPDSVDTMASAIKKNIPKKCAFLYDVLIKISRIRRPRGAEAPNSLGRLGEVKTG